MKNYSVRYKALNQNDAPLEVFKTISAETPSPPVISNKDTTAQWEDECRRIITEAVQATLNEGERLINVEYYEEVLGE